MYHMAYKNRQIFNKPKIPNRKNIGYKFANGDPIAISDSYSEFNQEIQQIKTDYPYFIQFDISAYFNSIYHHDLVNWFSSCGVEQSEVELFGQFMREINAGFSIDFLPHGIYPSKMLGSHFLSYIDNSLQIKSEKMVRFMDDIIIASHSKETVTKDFQTIQKLLGQKSLNINSHKTKLFNTEENSINDDVDEIISKIFGEFTIFHGSDVGFETITLAFDQLSENDISDLIALLDKDNISDQEVSLILETIRKHTNDLHVYLPTVFRDHPSLIKKIDTFCEFCDDKESLASGFLDILNSNSYMNEYQLFWLAKIVETHLLETKTAGKLLTSLYEHNNASVISKSKVLEIPELRFGMPELRETHLKNGTSSWLSWSSAVGMRNDTKQAKNYLMDYFSKVSPINKLIGDCVKKL